MIRKPLPSLIDDPAKPPVTMAEVLASVFPCWGRLLADASTSPPKPKGDKPAAPPKLYGPGSYVYVASAGAYSKVRCHPVLDDLTTGSDPIYADPDHVECLDQAGQERVGAKVRVTVANAGKVPGVKVQGVTEL